MRYFVEILVPKESNSTHNVKKELETWLKIMDYSPIIFNDMRIHLGEIREEGENNE